MDIDGESNSVKTPYDCDNRKIFRDDFDSRYLEQHQFLP